MDTENKDTNVVEETINPEVAADGSGTATDALKGAATAAAKTAGDALKTGEAAAQEAVEVTKKTITTATSAASKTINDAIKQVETIGKNFGSALQDRGNGVSVRVNNDSLEYLDILVESGIAKSRSESAAFLITEGIKANQELFTRIREITDQIASLKSQLRQAIKVEDVEA